MRFNASLSFLIIFTPVHIPNSYCWCALKNMKYMLRIEKELANHNIKFCYNKLLMYGGWLDVIFDDVFDQRLRMSLKKLFFPLLRFSILFSILI